MVNLRTEVRLAMSWGETKTLERWRGRFELGSKVWPEQVIGRGCHYQQWCWSWNEDRSWWRIDYQRMKKDERTHPSPYTNLRSAAEASSCWKIGQGRLVSRPRRVRGVARAVGAVGVGAVEVDGLRSSSEMRLCSDRKRWWWRRTGLLL